MQHNREAFEPHTCLWIGASWTKMARRPIRYSRSLSLDHYRASVRGLLNYSLSCCVNALLQSFSATTELLDILKKLHPSDKTGRNNIPLQLKNTLCAMRNTSNPEPHRYFLDCLYSHTIRRFTQQDADEIFHIILNLSQNQMPDQDLAQEIRNLYDIRMETQVMCSECTYVQRVPSSSFSLPLAIFEGVNTLESCIQSFFQRQNLLDGDKCYCDRCGQKQPSTHELRLVSLPQILCVHLKRFRNVGGLTRKLYSRVTFHETLNMGIFAAEGQSENVVSGSPQADENYRLYAVIVHIGFAMSGHYTAYIRPTQDLTWYYADDSTVHPVSWANVQNTYEGSETAYMLLYRKMSRNAPGEL
ncbi:ubl carboxyl-terminal hydrolase 18-like isoform X2 [Myxocyprinus asiaticus]|uniref:ubl carboxyl-terminal hydrolase 18-like isoform X2 n=1 Tax=Myxocyprinus asiaticus TaxID=70543 RepID=UPI002221E7FE|nr:ubl carboxyl-terminal hydrolase 18-like isoform X2 [Myxocyprinus asiaticus]